MVEFFSSWVRAEQNPISLQYSGHIVHPTESSKIYPVNFICENILIRDREQLNYAV